MVEKLGSSGALTEGRDEWQRAREWMRVLDEMKAEEQLTGEQVGDLARRWQVSRATAWRRIQRYRQNGNLSALVPKRPGRRAGAGMLDPLQEEVIVAAARSWWRQTENATVAEIEPSVIDRCVKAGIAPRPNA